MPETYKSLRVLKYYWGLNKVCAFVGLQSNIFPLSQTKSILREWIYVHLQVEMV
jgi:hypothetical protein